MKKEELFSAIVCALTHDFKVCDDCKKCKGKDYAEIRLNLIKELAKTLDVNLPWKEEKK